MAKPSKRRGKAPTGAKPASGLPGEVWALAATDPRAALDAARGALAANPRDYVAHRVAGRALRALGDDTQAERAERTAIHLSEQTPPMKAIEQQVLAGALAEADALLCARIAQDPEDAAALRILAALRMKAKRFKDAEPLLRRAVAIAPSFVRARGALAELLHETNRNEECLAALDWLAVHDPESAVNSRLRPATLNRLSRFDDALAFLELLLKRQPDHYKTWMSYGHLLKTVGRQADAIDAYRRSITLCPRFGEVWWSLANLKTVRFDDADIQAMSGALLAESLDKEDQLHLHFALGKAFEERGQWAQSFRHYQAGNALRRTLGHFDLADVEAVIDRTIADLTPEVFATRRNWGCPAPDPIFVVGMPRAGSTLIEQILASHSMVEGTQELPDIPNIGSRLSDDVNDYPGILTRLDADRLRALGEQYLEVTRIQRRTDRPFFIDKLPNNWMHVGLIRLILPNARIVDARRHPMASCFSNYKQHFAYGQNYTYDLEDVGGYYVQYVRAMAHWDRALPGAVHRVIYEDMVGDNEAEIRRLLDALGLPFEESCLRFWENGRAVRTASSEQVRRPINKDGMDAWKPYAEWLGPLERTLGDVLTAYPAVPERLARKPELATVRS